MCNTPFEIEPANLLCIVPNLTTRTIFRSTLHIKKTTQIQKKLKKKKLLRQGVGTCLERLRYVFGTSSARLWNVVACRRDV